MFTFVWAIWHVVYVEPSRTGMGLHVYWNGDNCIQWEHSLRTPL